MTAQTEEQLLAEIKKWKEIAEFMHAKQCWPQNLSLGQGALDAYAAKWPGFDQAVNNHLAELADAAPEYVPTTPDWMNS